MNDKINIESNEQKQGSAYSINYTISFGADVLPEDIQKKRVWLGEDGSDSLWNMEINKDSTDEEIAKFLGVENFGDFIQTEKVELEMEDVHEYSKEDTDRLVTQYHERIKEFKRMNNLK